MEIYSYCRIQFYKNEHAQLARLMLKADPDAPMFEDEVEEPLRELFDVLESIEISDAVSIDEEAFAVTAHWLVTGTGNVQSTLDELIKLDCVFHVLVLYFDDESNAYGVDMSPNGSRPINSWADKPLSEISHSANMVALLKNMQEHLVQS